MSAVGVVERFGGLRSLLRASSPVPHPSRWAWTADCVLAVVLAIAALDAALRQHDTGNIIIVPGVLRPPLPPLPPTVLVGHGVPVESWQLAVAVMTGLPLVVRRRLPLASYAVVLVATLVLHLDVRGRDSATITFIACVIAAYSAVMYSPYRRLAVWSVVVGAAVIAADHDASVPTIKPGYLPLLVLVPLGLLANTMHTWKQRARAAEEEQQAATRLAVEHERARIARELHDVVTHNVSVMVVQAGAARKVMDAAPEQAREALLAVEAGGRAAMAELRHVMGLLTMNGDGSEPSAIDLAPQPGLDQLPMLAERVRATGVPVEVFVTGTPTPLPPGVDLVAYRVVQEALTNTVKHADGASVRISVAYSPDELRIEVVDTGGTTAASAISGSGEGRGLIGMRERLAVYGGTLIAGKRPTGGYRISAVIPLNPVAPATPVAVTPVTPAEES